MHTTFTRRQFVSAVSALGVGATLAACGGGGSESGTASGASDGDLGLVNEGQLTIVDEYGFAPFDYMDESTNEPTGFDIDVIDAIAAKMGLQLNLLPNQSFDSLVPTIKQGGKADASIAAMTITDARKEEVAFTDPYLDSNQALIVKAGSGEDEGSLNSPDKTVSCQTGTTGEEWARENLTEATITPLDDVAAGLAGVQTGNFDGYVVDLPVASNLIAESYSDLEIALEIPTGEQYGIIVSHDNPALLEAINDALAAIEEDGTMDEIKAKWFGDAI